MTHTPDAFRVLLPRPTWRVPVLSAPHASRHEFALLAGAAAAAAFVLQLVATSCLVRRHREAVRRVQVQARATALLLAAGGDEEVFQAVLAALGELAGRSASVSLFVVAGDAARLVRPAGLTPPVKIASLPAEEAAVLGVGSPAAAAVAALVARLDPLGAEGLPAGGGAASHPVACRPGLRAVAVVTAARGARRPSPAALRGVPPLAGLVDLALARLELANEVRRHRSAARFSALIQNPSDVVWLVAMDSTVSYVNSPAALTLGLAPADLIGTRLLHRVHPEDRRAFLAALAGAGTPPAAAGGDLRVPPRVIEFRFRHPEGAWRYFEATVTDLRDDADVAAIALHARDVTERRRAEADQEALLGRLAQAQRLEAIGQLAGGVAHDFNNVLGAILMYAEAVGKSVGSVEAGAAMAPEHRDTIVHDIEKIAIAAHRGATLVSELLLVGRRDPARPEVVDVNRVIGELQELARDTAGERIHLQVRLGLDSLGARADRTGIERVLMNLVINARDAMPGPGTLTIETTGVRVDEPLPWAPDLRPGPYVRLSVSDTGVGMTREVRARAFEPFFTTKPVGRGTGLGLAAVYAIVKQAGGDIHVYSEPAAGTVVRVYLPAAPLPAVTEAPLPVACTPASGWRDRRCDPPGGAARAHEEAPEPVTPCILLVDDDAAVRDVTERTLNDAGYAVLTAHGAEAALQTAEAAGVALDLLLTDMVIPGASGAELAVALRSRRGSVPVLFMSGYPGDVFRPAGMGPLLAKPFTERALLEAVAAAIAAPEEAAASGLAALPGLAFRELPSPDLSSGFPSTIAS